VKTVEFFYSMTPNELKQINEDNINIINKNDNKLQTGLIKEHNEKEHYKDKDKDRDRDSSSNNASQSIITVQKDNNQFTALLNIKESMYLYGEELEIKKNILTTLHKGKQDIYKTINSNLLKRNIILRDKRGPIDHFNLNYHPIHTHTLQKLHDQIKSNYLINEVTKNQFNDLEAKEGYFNEINGVTLTGIAKFLKTLDLNNKIKIDKYTKTKTIINENKDNYQNSDTLKTNIEEKKNLTLNLDVTRRSINKREFVNSIKDNLNLDEYVHINKILTNIYNDFDDNQIKFLLKNPKLVLNFIYNDIDLFNQTKGDNTDYNLKEDSENDNYSVKSR
jgi:hypothetical protein